MQRRISILAVMVLALAALAVFCDGMSIHGDNMRVTQPDDQHCADHCSCPVPAAVNTDGMTIAPLAAAETHESPTHVWSDTAIPSSIFIPPRA